MGLQLEAGAAGLTERASFQYAVHNAAGSDPTGSSAAEEVLSPSLQAWLAALLRYRAACCCVRVVLVQDAVALLVFVAAVVVEAGSAGAAFPAPVAAWSCVPRATPRVLPEASFRQAGKQSGLPVALARQTSPRAVPLVGPGEEAELQELAEELALMAYL